MPLSNVLKAENCHKNINLSADESNTLDMSQKIYLLSRKTPHMSQSAWSPDEGVETFHIGSFQVMFHPDFIQAGTGESLKTPNLRFKYTIIMLYRLSNNSISPLQIWWMNTWNNWFLLAGWYAKSYISMVSHTQWRILWQGWWVYWRWFVYTFSWCQKIVQEIYLPHQENAQWKRQEEKFWNQVGPGGEGSWLLCQSMCKCESLGEKIESIMEMYTHKSVCKNSWLCLQEAYLHCMALMLCNIHIYLEDNPHLPLHTDFGHSETYDL